LSIPPAKSLEKRASKAFEEKKKALLIGLCASPCNVFCWQQETHVLYYGGAVDRLGVIDLGLL